MIVDIHTHSSVQTDYPAIRNLNFDEAENVFASDENGFFSVGFHPWYADEFSTILLNKLTAWTSDSRFVALGECGLDKNSQVPFDMQIRVLEIQIALSEKTCKPMIIHCVSSFNELFELKKKLNPHQLWIIHGFRGKPQLASQALHAGCALSFGEHFNPESVRLTPIDRLFIETDESVQPVSEIYRSISLIKNCQPDDLHAGENLIKLMK
ncbi:MAG: TatD family hydrolase [Paludibacter sp.]|nr:TatD family hydrolase [Paludibacter sp.]